MAYWDGKKIVDFEPESIPDFPGWQLIDCGCCAGLQWGGEEPRECKDCGGSGRLFLHVKSRVLADYPGGPLRGRMEAERT